MTQHVRLLTLAFVMVHLGGCVSPRAGAGNEDEPDASSGGGSGGSGGSAGKGGSGGSGTGGSNGGSGGGGVDAGGQPGKLDAGAAGRGGAGGSIDAGGGGQAGIDAGANPTPDARVTPDASPAGDGGRPSNPALDQKCTVPVKFTNQAAAAMGGMIFDREIPDVVATMQAHARAICNIIYRKPEEVKNVTMQGLTIDMHDGVAFASGGNINFSAVYINSFSNGKTRQAINFELNGVLVHESTHVWQYTNGGGWLVEAMADYVRYKAGFDKLSRRGRGGNWNSPYTTGGFFIVWIEEKFDPDFGYKVNMGMKTQGFNYADLVKQVSGKDIDALWAEYQAAI